MKRLIINADDYGLTEGVSHGICEACQKGIVRSVSVLMTHARKMDLAALKELENVSLGVHLNLTSGKPVLGASKNPSLVDEKGKFYKRWEQLDKRANVKEIEKEFKAQIEMFTDAGLKPCHLDTHHHIHSVDRVLDIVIRLARKLGVAVRSPTRAVRARLKTGKLPTTDNFTYEFYDEPHITLDGFRGLLDRLSDGLTELVCHPGIVSDDLFPETTYSYQRGIEMATLTHGDALSALQERKIKLTDFCAIIKGR